MAHPLILTSSKDLTTHPLFSPLLSYLNELGRQRAHFSRRRNQGTQQLMVFVASSLALTEARLKLFDSKEAGCNQI